MRSLFQNTLFMYLAPLLLYALTYLFGCFLKEFLFNNKFQSNNQNLSFPQDDYNECQSLIPFLSLILKEKTPIINAYGFFIMMTLMNIISLIGSLVISNFDKNKLNHSCQKEMNKENDLFTKKEFRSSRGGYQRIFKGIILYGILSSFYSSAVSAYSPTEFLSHQNQEISSNSLISHLSFPAMISNKNQFLKEEEEIISISTPDPPSISPDIRTLSIGKILGTLRLNLDSIILSHDSKLAFIILKNIGALRVIDISDDQYPIIIGSLELTSTDMLWHYKKMALSADGKSIFATMIQYLEIIDVSDPQNPALIARLKDPQFSDTAPAHPYFCLPTMALSSDEKILHVAASGLQIFNPFTVTFKKIFFKISGKMIPIFCPTFFRSKKEFFTSVVLQILLHRSRFSSRFQIFQFSNSELDGKQNHLQPLCISDRVNTADQSPKRPIKVTSLALFPDSKTLLYADETLDFYDTSDPTKPKLTSSYSDPEILMSSVVLSKTLKKVYAIGLNKKESLFLLEEIDISQRDSPKSLGQYPLSNFRILNDYPSIIAISPNETNIFIAKGVVSTLYEAPFELIGFNLLKKQIMMQSTNFFVDTTAFVMIPGTDKVITNSNDQFQITRLFKNYPNTKTFCFTNNSRAAFQFSKNVKFIAPSQDQNTLFALSVDVSSSVGYIESYNFTNKTSLPLQLLSSLKFDLTADTFSDVELTIQENSAFIRDLHVLAVFNISDPTNITLQGLISSTDEEEKDAGIQNVFHSPKQKVILALIGNIDSQESEAKIIDYSDMSSIIETHLVSLPNSDVANWAGFSDKRKILFLFSEDIMIYNISDPKAPKLVSSQPLIFFEERLVLLPVTFSTDEKTLFIIMIDQNHLTFLYTIDVSDLTNVKILSVLDLPKILQDSGKQPLILSRDMKRGFLVTDQNILVIDFKNLTAPAIVGMISLEILSNKEVSNFFMSPDEKIGYLSGFQGQLLQIGLDIPYTLFLQQEKFFLGKKYSDSILFLQSNDSSEFGLMDSSEYQIIKLLSYNFKLSPMTTSPTFSYSSLPSWISFDSENQVFSVESKKQSDLGSCTLYSISSKKIPLEVFNSTLPHFIISSDMITTLISLGYVNNQQFLTSSFGSYEKFLLPSQYWTYKEIIYSTLLSYRIETFTDFEILPSLKLSTPENKKISVSTPSNFSVKVDIKLHSSNETKAEFLQKNYGVLRPIITDHKSRLTIEGPLDAINQALKDLVINLNNTNSTSCSGEITINDKMNPLMSESYQNIFVYFFKNEAPHVNPSHPLTLQQQIDQNILYTGQSFTIQIDPNTFMDNFSDTLTYELIQPSSNGAENNNLPPSWLTLQNGLTLKGTPPEDFLHREVHLILIVKNEFKQIQVPFVLNIKISLLFAGKLLLRFSPYILTVIGLIVSVNKIYSILMKKKYKHPKDFYVKAGEEITSSVIFPIKFIAAERAEGEMIFKNLLLSENSDETKIKEAIQEIADGLNTQAKEKLRLYFQGDFGKKRVEQYIINNVIMQQLDATEEKATKNLFDSVKEDWVEFIEYEDNSFKVNETRLEKLFSQRNQLNNDLAETFNDSLLSENGPEINFTLLKKALVVYASRKHEINYLERKVDIEVKSKTERNFLWRFLKRDLERIPYSEKSRMVYGINYRIQGDALHVSGTPDENFVGNTLVLQIISKRQRVLKELWIYGVTNSAGDENKERTGNGIGIGPQVIEKSYEVF